MKTFRVILWLLVAVAAGFSGYTFLNKTAPEQSQEQAIKIGGPFELVTNKNDKITQQDLLGKPHAIFFGFTNCPDICPTTLLQTAGWMKTLGDDSEKIGFYFFSVDPERDTPEIMNDYVNAFDPRITAVTGDSQEMTKTIQAYRGYAKRVDLGEGDYTMDHTAYVMLFRADGSFKGTISFDESDDNAVAKLKKLIKNS